LKTEKRVEDAFAKDESAVKEFEPVNVFDE